MGIIGDLDIKFLEDLEEEIFMLQAWCFFPQENHILVLKFLAVGCSSQAFCFGINSVIMTLGGTCTTITFWFIL